MLVNRFDLKDNQWRVEKVESDSVPLSRYGHSAVLYQVDLAV